MVPLSAAAPGALLVFAKAPVPGQAKTRLIPALGPEGAAALQQRLLNRTLATASMAGAVVQLWCSPDRDHPAFDRVAERYALSCYPQQGSDLGARMAHALQMALLSHPYAVIIGTDCPQLTPELLRQALGRLAQGEDAVIGPAADGGYYLLGLRRFEASLFEDIDWGSDQVLAQTRERMAQSGLCCGTLARLHDLDRPEDLERFAELLEG